MSLYRDFVRDNVLVLSGNVLVYAKGIILLPLVIKFFGVSSYGAYSLFASYVSIVYGISSLGVGFRFQRYMPSAKTAEERRQLFIPQFLFRASVLAVLGAGFMLTRETVDRVFLKNSSDYTVFAVLLMLASMLVFAQSTDYFRYTARMKYFVAGTATNPYLLIGSLAVGVALFDQRSLDFLLYSSSAAMLIACAPLAFIMVREIGFSFSFYRLPELVKDAKLGLPITVSIFLDFLMAGSDRFVIAFFLSAAAVGFYAPAYTLASLIVVFPKVLGVVLPPLLSRAVDGGQVNTAEVLVNKAVKSFLLIAIPYVMATVILARPLLEVLANEEVADSVAHLVPVMGTGFIFYGLVVILSHGVAFTKLQTKWILYSNVLAGTMSVSLNLVVMSLVTDLYVPALVSVLSFGTAYLVLKMGIRDLMTITYDIRSILKSIVGSLGMSGVLLLLTLFQVGPLATILVSIPVGFIVYGALLLVLRTFNDQEMAFVSRYFRAGGGK